MKIAVVLSILFFSFQTLAQNYSADREKFFKELQKELKPLTPKEEFAFIEDVFEMNLLESDLIKDEVFERMVKTANLIIEKRMDAYPEVYNYVFSVNALMEKKANDSYTAWHQAIDKQLDSRNSRKFEEFIQVSKAFFQRRVIYINNGFEWFYEGGAFDFVYNRGPEIVLENGNLICRTINTSSSTKKEIPYTDSMVVYNTSGVYDPALEKWQGKGGEITWEKVGLDREKTKAKISYYDVSMKSPYINIDTAYLTSTYFSEPIIGKLSERAQRGAYREGKGDEYPQFSSFENRLSIPNIVEGVNYEGGFSLKGAEFVGLGTRQEPIRLSFKKGGKEFITTESQTLNITEDKLSTRNCKTIIHLSAKDSIWHPGVRFAYDRTNKRIQLVRGNVGVEQSPFTNTFHDLDMYVTQISWAIDSDVLDFDFGLGTSQEQRIARFESRNYYDQALYESLQGMESIHPLVALSKYSYKYDLQVMPEGTAASALGRTTSQAKQTFLKLSSLGFISYDTDKGEIILKDKLYNFINARSGKQDYDNIVFESNLAPMRPKNYTKDELEQNPSLRQELVKIEQHNNSIKGMQSHGNINLNTMNMALVAVSKVPISDYQATAIFPDSSKVLIKENRDVIFKGWVNSGKWQIDITNGYYDYAENKINITSSDIALFRVNPLRPEDGKTPISLQSSLTGIVGYILVDDPNNRSGLKEEFHNYPMLYSEGTTKVFWEYDAIHQSAYKKENFFFEVEPFTIDSLDNFDEKSIAFNGQMHSAGIFPVFEQDLTIMGDYSLGFSTVAPTGGYDFYGDVAKYENKIVLSNNGLQGAGQIDFIQSTSISKAFTFLPDSTIGIVEFKNEPLASGVQFPDAESPNAFMTYLPRNKMLKVKSTRDPIKMYEGESNLFGTAVIQPSGMTGMGRVDMEKALLSSNAFEFDRWDIISDSAAYYLKNLDKKPGDLMASEYLLTSENVKTKIDLKGREGTFSIMDDDSELRFPVNEFRCSVKDFDWKIDEDEIILDNPEDKAKFYALRPEQKMLTIESGNAQFDMKNRIINCYETEFVEIADALIYPDSQYVEIQPKAVIDTLRNSVIKSRDEEILHTIVNANTTIQSSESFLSFGDYKYYDLDSTLHYIPMHKVYVDKDLQTRANGKVAEGTDFMLSPQFDFYGDVELYANNPLINFKGATKIVHDCEGIAKNWMAFSSAIDPKDVQIPVGESPEDLEGNAISAGLVWRNTENLDSLEIYPTFLSAVENEADTKVISGTGFLKYNPASYEFEIGNKEKLLDLSAVGNYVSLNLKTCGMYGNGKVDLGMDFGDLEIASVGTVIYNQAKKEANFNLTMQVKTPMDEKVFEAVANKINLQSNLAPADLKSNTLVDAIATWSSEKDAQNFSEKLGESGTVKKLPKEVEATFVFSGVRLSTYDLVDDYQKGLKTSMSKAILVSINDVPVLKYVDFKLFAEQRVLLGDKVGFMIDMPGGYSYYFFYEQGEKRGQMDIITSDQEFNTSVMEIKEDKRKIKKFEYGISDDSVLKSQFLRIFGGI
ncbi:hypothetical protein [Lishizhenia sp.]|uniref:hypothetical protein n=1 Tax=Lishizhenia sp. TaxID=2497594 RepID=UPI00299E3C00|nr:hypothetical protein [Lishizhenia sp.]MDX1446745.1 hypothetical protein [Lishizhenia sp.]